MKLESVILQTGSNIGDREKFLENAILALSQRGPAQDMMVSRIHETEPWGNPNQPRFLNQIICFGYSGTPQELLRLLWDIEAENGRTRDGQLNMPRTLDLDILCFGDLNLKTSVLEIPHPRMHLRRFILEPLQELLPEFIHPTLKLSIPQMLAELPLSH